MSKDEQIQFIEKTIGELVVEKTSLAKAYNYYNGVRNAEQFRYLEENYGLGNPTSLTFIPFVRKHLDAIVGEYLDVVVLPKVSCKDEETLSAITNDRRRAVVEATQNFLTEHLQTMINRIAVGKSPEDPFLKEKAQKIQEDADMDFISEYEIAAQNIIQFLLQSRDIDFHNKRRQLLLDLLITGWFYYTVIPTEDEENMNFEVLSPLDVFPDVNPNSPYVKDSYRVVVRRWYDKYQILNLYGSKLTKTQRQELEENLVTNSGYSSYYIRANEYNATRSELNQDSVIPVVTDSEKFNVYNLIPVYDVEWLKTDSDGVIHRYSGTKIAEDIFIINDVDKNVIRSKNHPKKCTLSVNGIYFSNRGTKAYSLMLACIDIQDKFDILNFYRDNLIANSGTVGDWLDISTLPTELGVSFSERLQKYIAYKKSGLGLINTSQEGRAFNNNTQLAGFDDTIKVEAIQAIELAIERLETTLSGITGVFRERLDGITQLDAVTNIQRGVRNSYIVTKQWTQQMDLGTTEILYDFLNMAKIVYKNGITGALILGDKYQHIFKALPKHYTLTDYDIHIVSGAEIMKDMETIQTICGQFITAGTVDAEIILEAMTAKSLTELKYKVKKAIRTKKEELNMVGKLQEQVKQLEDMNKQYEEELKKAQDKIDTVQESKIQIEQQKMQMQYQLDWFKANYMKEQGEEKLKIEKSKVDLEAKQMYDGNPYNDAVNFNK